MDKYKAKPQGNYVVVAILWLLAFGAVAIVATMLFKYDVSALNSVIFMVIPVFFFIPAVAASYATAMSSIAVEEGKVVSVMVAGFKRYTLQFSLDEVRAVWPYRRTVSTGRHMQVATGCAFRRADGATLSLDLTLYTDLQRQALISAVCAQGKDVEVLPFVPDTGRVFYPVMPPVWLTPSGDPADAPSLHTEAQEAVVAASAALDEARQAPVDAKGERAVSNGDSESLAKAEEAIAEAQGRVESADIGQEIPQNSALIYHYRSYEGEGSARCSLCGARIASAVTPGEHQTGGYLASRGKKWVCKDCWQRFAKDYHWVAED